MFIHYVLDARKYPLDNKYRAAIVTVVNYFKTYYVKEIPNKSIQVEKNSLNDTSEIKKNL